jgi:hypothetical protein
MLINQYNNMMKNNRRTFFGSLISLSGLSIIAKTIPKNVISATPNYDCRQGIIDSSGNITLHIRCSGRVGIGIIGPDPVLRVK